MFNLGTDAISLDASLLETSVKLSRELDITIYDSCYLALAQKVACPLVTANSLHQKQVPGCDIIPVERWRLKP
jgi:predicted nucleic acid-binding protein